MQHFFYHIKQNKTLCFALCALCIAGCSIKYSFTGASIAPAAKTFSVQTFPNMAPLVVPSLSASFTDALTMKMLSNTRLQQTNENGDLSFEGEITNYTVTPQAITANEIAAQNRLTIAVHVKFANAADPTQDFDKSFSQYEDYPSEQNLSDVEAELITGITEKLIEDIFNAAVANW
ncbi:hypothetical protein FACS1894156_4840 [Bacteroidia bacterium]|nr:hypothetical protein FACS1894156_4840 [Bacteroidia bacterium]